MEFFRIRRTIPFMRHAFAFNVLSAATFLAAVFFLATQGLNLSIEFTGGTLVEATYPRTADIEGIRGALERAGLDAEVQRFGSSRDVLIRLQDETGRSSAALAGEVQASTGPGFFQRELSLPVLARQAPGRRGGVTQRPAR